jgi:hypothetical protein
MPFVSSTPVPWAHLQADNDPVRAAAEAKDGVIANWLASAWNTLWSIDGPHTPQRMADEMMRRTQGITQVLNSARWLGQEAMSSQIGNIRKDFSVGFQFNRQSPAVQEQADLHAAQFVREIGGDTRTTLNSVMRDAVARGLGPPETARAMRESIGLTVSQANAVQNYRRLLTAGDPAAAARALHDQRYGLDVANLTPEQIDARVDAYRRRYVAYRATTIARTETLRASNSGAVSVIQSAVKSGALPRGTVKTWMVAKDERTCARCLSIPKIQPDGVPVDEPFAWHAGNQDGQIMLAPLHPDCRCTNSFRVIGR